MKAEDYIFCPFCGGHQWITDKTKAYPGDGRLEYHKCAACKKFKYTNVMKKGTSPAGLEIIFKEKFKIEATINPYVITVHYDSYYHKNSTQFQDINTKEVILVVMQAIEFNWYKNEELVDKIKKYVVFS